MDRWNLEAEEEFAARVNALASAGRGGRKPGSRNLPKEPRHCQALGCGELFTPTRASAMYCSDACKQRAYRAAHGANTRTRYRLEKES